MESSGTPRYQLILTNRSNLQANGVMEVESFDEQQIVAMSKLGPLVIKGQGLHITQLNLESGQLALEGDVLSIQYVENKKLKLKRKGSGIVERLFK